MFSGLHELVVVREAPVVVLQLVEAVHHVGATRIHSGVFALVSYVVVDVLFLPLLLDQLSQVGLVLVQLSVPPFTNPFQFDVWLDAVGVEVLLETVVVKAVQCLLLGLSS